MKHELFERTTLLGATIEDVFEFFSGPQNLAVITPPKMRLRVITAPSRALREGDRLEYRFSFLGVPLAWRTRITLWRDNEAFSDFQERGPYRYWLHTHTFRQVPEGVEMTDRVEYSLPFGILGRWVGGWLVRRELEKIFDYRAEAIRRAFTT
jgi:ligand-binding SRPBCC domain-containing protein